jgi:hypothetical protein
MMGFRSKGGYSVTGVRRHSPAVTVRVSRVTASNPRAMSRATDPSCWWGSHPDIASIQSNHTGVVRQRMPVIEVMTASIQIAT